MRIVLFKSEPRPLNRGAYCLVISLSKDAAIAVGVRPPHRFPAGYYCYVGSAMTNLKQRIARHISSNKRRRWHIDYLLDQAAVTAVLVFESNLRLECPLSQAVAGLADGLVMKGFGSSDCRCRTHLYYFLEDPLLFLETLGEKFFTPQSKLEIKALD